MEIATYNRIPRSSDHAQPVSFEQSGIIDMWKSLIVNWRAYYYSDVQLSLPIDFVIGPNQRLILSDKSQELFDNLKAENLLLINNRFFYIDSIKIDKISDGILPIYGKSLLGKATKRIIIPTYSVTNKPPESIVYDLINKNLVPDRSSGAYIPDGRHYDYLSIADSPTPWNSPIASYQSSYQYVNDETKSLCETNGIVTKETAVDLQNPLQEIEVMNGVDRSVAGQPGYVEFSLDNDNLLSESYENTTADMASLAYVFGEGEGNARKMVTTSTRELINPSGQGTYQSLDVNEFYVDARDLQQTYNDSNNNPVTLTDQQYIAQLTQRGQTELQSKLPILKTGGEINTASKLFLFGQDYEVGDRVRINNSTLSMYKSSVLTEMQETWDDTGYYLAPTFDKDSPTLLDKIKRRN